MTSKYSFFYLATVIACLSLTACRERPLYYHYELTPAEGWDLTDTLHFTVPAMAETGEYQLQVGLRLDGSYPYRNLSIVVEQQTKPSGVLQRDTLNCEVVDETGHPLGKGVSIYQYLFPLTTLQLNEGERLDISIYHNMRREILPGINSVGVMIEK